MKLIVFISLSCTLSPFTIGAMQPYKKPPTISVSLQPILVHKKRSADELVKEIPTDLAAKPLLQLNALMEQQDHFSCGYRTLFHAQCLSIALTHAAQGDNLEDSLKTLFLDQGMLDRTFGHIKNYLDQHYPHHDRTIGLCLHHILGTCAAHIPLLHAHLLPVLLEDGKMYTLHDPTLLRPSPLHYSADFIRNYLTTRFPQSTCHVELDSSQELKHQLKQLEKPHSIAHFLCRYPNHIFLATITTDEEKKAKLYMIDPNNNNLATAESIRILTTKILSYVEAHNTRQAAQNTKKQKAIDLAPT